MSPAEFQHNILNWFDKHGRKDLPWQQHKTPYRVWLSEIMLQQTQVSTVIPYFNAFTEKFPDLEQLATANLDDVLQLWAGLGYYARARNLHHAAQLIVTQGEFPNTLAGLMALPGIGQSTAGAILSMAFKQAAPILDGNVKRVLARFMAIAGWTGSSSVNKQLWAISRELTPTERVADYTQAMMDLGATLCTRRQPLCLQCPIQVACKAWRSDTVHAYPSPKPAKILPIKQCCLLLLKDTHQRVLLEKRPPTGIWGGLWSLPEFADVDDALTWCELKNFAVHTSHELTPRRHTFSHYHLDYTPLLIQCQNPINFVLEANQRVWYNEQQIGQLGLPAPIKNLLTSLNYEDNHDKISKLYKTGQRS